MFGYVATRTGAVANVELVFEEAELSEVAEPEIGAAEMVSGNVVSNQETVALSSTPRSRIVRDTNVLGGEPHVRGTRIPISAILDGLAEGLKPKDLMEHFPRLTAEDIQAALNYAASEDLVQTT